MRLRVLVLPFALFLLHAAMFGSWMVDDAGISLAFARNLAAGHGLVSQPGMPPVEGYSNPLWVLILFLGFLLTPLGPLALSKLISIALVFAAFFVCTKTLADNLQNGRLLAVFALSLLSLQTSIVVWCMSGLENGLTLFLSSLLFASLASPRLDSPMLAWAMGCLMTAFSLTRPESVVYTALYPISLFLFSRNKVRRPLSIYFIVILATSLPYLLVRLLYFHDPLPNAYYAKGGPHLDTVVALLLFRPSMIDRTISVISEIVGAFASWTLVAVVVVIPLACVRGTWTRIHTILGLLCACSLVAYLLMPPDWMPAHRYATSFLLCATILIGSLIFGGLCPTLTETRLREASVCALLVLIVVFANVSQTLRFRREPTISTKEVADRARRLEIIAGILHAKSASWLTPDVGGALLYSRLQVFDLGMLCDRRIAHYLGEGMPSHDVQAFHDYVFNELKPTFISMRAYHSWIAKMNEDPRFRRDYVPLHEFVDDWIKIRYGETEMSGEYVRLSNVRASNSSLQAIQSVWAKYPSPWDR